MFSRIFLPLIFVLFFASCDSDDPISDELTRNRILWEASNIKSYSMNERVSCFCGGLLDWQVVVLNGVKDTVTFDESQLPQGQTYQEVFDNARTVDDVFEFIKSLEGRELASLEIEYNQEFGFPTLVSIDYVENIADDEVAYIYSDFKIIDAN